MDCKHCGPFDSAGNIRRGLKPKGKTKRAGTTFERIYQCQDCGAHWRLIGDSATKQFREMLLLSAKDGTA